MSTKDEFSAGFRPMKLKTAAPPPQRTVDAQRLDWLLQPSNRWFMHNIAQTNAEPSYLRKLIDKQMS
jgi:hypothetical protein